MKSVTLLRNVALHTRALQSNFWHVHIFIYIAGFGIFVIKNYPCEYESTNVTCVLCSLTVRAHLCFGFSDALYFDMFSLSLLSSAALLILPWLMRWVKHCANGSGVLDIFIVLSLRWHSYLGFQIAFTTTLFSSSFCNRADILRSLSWSKHRVDMRKVKSWRKKKTRKRSKTFTE